MGHRIGNPNSMIFFLKTIKYLSLVLNIEAYVCVILIHYLFFS